ncbi:hypothetical protein LE181_06645 [Streptomyces sp. SCA3-4]|uniref:hypothetical protein n=1 Tax=Streptomyces sichuanensis TaxID=2871810 RepID=UPI001CE33098|nr:hypothetical protein [Streptomyces sichuanensis]MCA6091843.1 hypothetical protein [Streptomyces sichuanensis]
MANDDVAAHGEEERPDDVIAHSAGTPAARGDCGIQLGNTPDDEDTDVVAHSAEEREGDYQPCGVQLGVTGDEDDVVAHSDREDEGFEPCGVQLGST